MAAVVIRGLHDYARKQVTVVFRNSIYNMLGLGLPLIVAMAAIPVLIHSLGAERFGILTIIWAVVSYFGLFDFGLGRTVTQQVAASLAAGDDARLKGILGTSSALMFAMGLVGGIVMAATAPLLARQFAHSIDLVEVTRAFYWMALAMPAIVLTSGYRGTLEALGRFGTINMIRVPMGVFTYAGPMVVVWAGYDRLDTIAAVLCAGRILACLVHARFAIRSVPGEAGAGHFDRSLVRSLLRMGGWMSVSNIVAPLMNYVDRVALGVIVSATAVAYYATPQELILRVGIVPAAFAGVLFPLFAASGAQSDRSRDVAYLWRYSLLILFLMLPVTLILFLFASTILTWWISADFAINAAPVLQVMSLAVLISGLSQVSFTMLQGQGRADLTAKLHIVEFPLFLALLYGLTVGYGPIGAAWAWLIRIAVDFLALSVMCTKHLVKSEGKLKPAGV